jgi:cyclic pyranopterin monophosphate synthase
MVDMKKKANTEESSFSHLDGDGHAHMVNVGGKEVQSRRAVAEAYLVCSAETIHKLRKNALPKGNVLTVAQIAGIQAAKRTAELIPLCHQLPLNGITVEFTVEESRIRVLASAEASGRTGVEMEALMAASIAALTLYDMCKAVDKSMSIEGIRVLEKVKA